MSRPPAPPASPALAPLSSVSPLAPIPPIPPTSARPRPSAAQLAWQREELALFVHFTVNTFTGLEWGMGSESPAIFNPSTLDAHQWARVAKEGGAGTLILTAKHHDGFCLWPTKTTTHSVVSSPWRDGKGDVVREFVDACRAEGLDVGLYLSPWDRNAACYGQGEAYNDFYIEQLTELLTQYGPIVELWFDGANGEGPNGKKQEYDWPRIRETVRRLQPGAVMFSDGGPDLRWIGNETGSAGSTCWSSVDPQRVPYAGFDAPWVNEALQQGDPHGQAWRVGETDVSIRQGWFWRSSEDDKVRSAGNLLALYFSSVGRNSKLLLNIPPTDAGLFHENDVREFLEFARLREQLFASDAAPGASLSASSGGETVSAVFDGDPDSHWITAEGEHSGWLELRWPQPVTFDVVHLREAIAEGQHIANYRIDVWRDGAWAPLTWGTTIGYCKLNPVPLTETDRLRVVIENSYDRPRIARIALHRNPTGNTVYKAPWIF